MDPLALRLANRLVGNPDDTAALEITLPGLTLRTLAPCRIAITGADLSAQLDDEPIGLWQNRLLRPGQQLSFRKRIRGTRAYLAIEGGFEAERVFDSQSTDLRNGWAGLAGRSLQKEDLLFQQPTPGPPGRCGPRSVRPQILWEYQDPFLLRVLPGPQAGHFSGDSLNLFFGEDFRVHPRSNRMGYRLDGPLILASPPEIISDPVPLGGIQVLPSGQLVLLMADHQTVGGYPKIAVLISADLPKAAQLGPGHRIHFKAVTLEQAHEALARQEERLAAAVADD